MKRAKLVLVAWLLIFALSFSVGASADLEDAIIRGCETDEWTNLRGYDISEEEFETLFFQMRYDGKLPWYVDYSYSYYSDDESGKMLSFKPDVLDPQVYDRLSYELAVAELLFEVIHPDMTQTQMALAVHDYLITHCAYDESYEHNTGYDLLLHGTTACAGYSELYMDILQRLGIPCIVVESEGMDHAWNLVCLEDAWYHVDVTWDDPTPDIYGQVMHEYFLLTDAQISQGEEPHYDWHTDKVCNSERYTDAFWRQIDSALWYVDTDTWIFREGDDAFVGAVYSYEESTQKRTRLTSSQEQYINIGYGQYAYWHTGLSVWNGRIYYNNMTSVYSTDLQGKNRRLEYTHSSRTEKTFLIGTFVEDDQLYVSLSDHDGEHCTNTQVALKATGYHQHSYQVSQLSAGCETPEYTRHGCACGVELLLPVGPASGHRLNQVSVEENTIQIGCENCHSSYELVLPECVFFRWLPDLIQNIF